MARILLIHDEGAVRDHLAAALQYWGHAVTSESSRSAIDDPMIGDPYRSRYDLIIVDELVQATAPTDDVRFMKALYPGAKILAISRHGRGRGDVREITRAAGANATLSKPFSTADLSRTLDGTLLTA